MITLTVRGTTVRLGTSRTGAQGPPGEGGGGDVESVFGRTGAVTSESGDYEASEVTFAPTADVDATDVQAAIADLGAGFTALSTALASKVDTTDPRLSDARTPTAHASSHQPGGSDAIPTATAIELTDSSSAEGDSTSLARANHTHAHGSRGGGSLHAEASDATAGFMSAADYDAAYARKGGFRYVEDWLNGSSGTLGWAANQSGSGSGTTAPGTTYANHIGVVQISTGTTATGRGSQVLRLGELLELAGGQVLFDVVLQVPALSDGSESFDAFVGLGNLIASEPSNGVYFAYDDGLGANWFACCAVGGTRTRVDTGVAVAAGAWKRLRVVVNAAGTSASFYIDGVLVATIATNVPGAGVGLGGLFTVNKSVGTTARTLLVDLFGVDKRFSSPR